jgi:hypothetical protein
MLSDDERTALAALAADLGRVFADRLRSLAAYGLDVPQPDPRVIHTLALVERLTFADLIACTPLTIGWRRRGLAVPLLLEGDEFVRSLDAFPLEYGDIIASHVLIAGSGTFADVRVSPADVRRACETQAKSHLIHLRQGYLEAGGDPRRTAQLVAASAQPFRALLRHISRLADDHDADVAASAERQIGIPAALVREVFAAGTGAAGSIADPSALMLRYVQAVERVWEYVDGWTGR